MVNVVEKKNSRAQTLSIDGKVTYVFQYVNTVVFEISIPFELVIYFKGRLPEKLL